MRSHGYRPISTTSATVNGVSGRFCWVTSERARARSRACIPEMSTPPTLTRPACGVRRPAITDSSVDFPHPLGPTSTTSSPGATSSVTSRTTVRPPSSTSMCSPSSPAVVGVSALTSRLRRFDCGVGAGRRPVRRRLR
ncbi:Uncharacterised protein [Mycobacteroides abscessus subsp. abscessus]|nr:Uncharacterised protein [Mycobacteroides abscessus subsp. abscessus]